MRTIPAIILFLVTIECHLHAGQTESDNIKILRTSSDHKTLVETIMKMTTSGKPRYSPPTTGRCAAKSSDKQ